MAKTYRVGIAGLDHWYAALAAAEMAQKNPKTELTVRQVFPPWDSLTPAEQQLLAPRMGGAKEGWTQSLRHLGEYVKR